MRQFQRAKALLFLLHIVFGKAPVGEPAVLRQIVQQGLDVCFRMSGLPELVREFEAGVVTAGEAGESLGAQGFRLSACGFS